MMACVLRGVRKTDLMEPFPRVRAYCERCLGRPAWQRTLALYAERPDPLRPVVCFDETPRQLIGEERVTTQFSGLVMAYEDESEESFLTTQQVDEARHAVFFKRFMHEVVGVGDGTLAGGLRATAATTSSRG